MTLNQAFRYQKQSLFAHTIDLGEVAASVGTPTYVYSLRQIRDNLTTIQTAFAHLDTHIHFSAKANGNLRVLHTLIEAGAGVDCVSAGEIFTALKAGADPSQIVFAGVGKTRDEIRFAIDQGIGWFNVENELELRYINQAAQEAGRQAIRVALRLNPDVSANTHPNIATGHGAAKFGLTTDTVRHILASKGLYTHLQFAGIHLHIGSQLHDTTGTVTAIEKAQELMTPYPELRTLNIGGGIPVAYQTGETLPSAAEFAHALTPLLTGYEVLLEPGRSIVANAGILLTRVLYIKEQGGQRFVIVDAGMNDLMRPALYNATHEIVPLRHHDADRSPAQVVGPVCETTDVLGRDILLPDVQPDDLLAIMTVGAYGMVMAGNYNARPRPAEVVIESDGNEWSVARPRETWDDLLASQLL